MKVPPQPAYNGYHQPSMAPNYDFGYPQSQQPLPYGYAPPPMPTAAPQPPNVGDRYGTEPNPHRPSPSDPSPMTVPPPPHETTNVVRLAKASSSTTPRPNNHRTGRWSLDEKILFLYGLRKFGKGRWKKMSVYLPNRCVLLC